MNIFVLDKDTSVCAKYHCDKHVVKMIVETAQILSTAHYVLDNDKYKDLKEYIYKQTHINHPAVKWVCESRMNYLWLCELGLHLCKEYTIRFGKVHKTEAILFILYKNMPDNGKYQMTEFPRIFPIEYGKIDNTIEAYREYYKGKSSKFEMRYTNAPVPFFLRNLNVIELQTNQLKNTDI